MGQDAVSSGRSAPARTGEVSTRESRDLQTGMIQQELVDRIADRVYAMLLSEIKIEAERRRTSIRKPFAERGGW